VLDHPEKKEDVTETIKAVINLDIAGPVIRRHIYGHFAEHLGGCIYGGFYVGEDSTIPNDQGIRLDVVDALKRIDIPNLRWPGGCFADEYHWKDGIGPKQNRPSLVNSHWGDVEENNHFGTHEFMHLCELLDTEPYIAGNLGSGSVEEMSQWVEYLTRPSASPMTRLRRDNGREEPWRVKFWGLGNESWGCGGNMRPEHYADLARQYGTYCRNHGDNELYRIACGPNVDDYAWTEALMKTVGDLGCGCGPHDHFQAIALHHYSFAQPPEWAFTDLPGAKGSASQFSVEEYYQTVMNAQRMDELITRHSTIMDCYDPSRRIGLVVDEWGTWFDVEPGTNPGFLFQQNTLRDALVAGLHFDIFHRHAQRVVMANLAQTVNVLQSVLHTDGAELILTPTYHVFEMNKRHQDATRLDVHLASPMDVRPVGGLGLRTLSISASTKNGSALLSLTNLDAESERIVEVDLRGGTFDVGRARVLTANQLADYNSAERPGAVAPRDLDEIKQSGDTLTIQVPAHSFVTVELESVGLGQDRSR
jgi:alpha-N-arabinofuranosidase